MEKELENNEVPSGRGSSQPPLVPRPKSTVMLYCLFLLFKIKTLSFNYVRFNSKECRMRRKRGKKEKSQNREKGMNF